MRFVPLSLRPALEGRARERAVVGSRLLRRLHLAFQVPPRDGTEGRGTPRLPQSSWYAQDHGKRHPRSSSAAVS